MKPGDWVIIDLTGLTLEKMDGFDEYLGYIDEETGLIMPPHFKDKEVVEGQIVENPSHNSQKGPRVNFPWIAERKWREVRIPWEWIEPGLCEEHGKRLYHDYREEWYCPFCQGEYSGA